MLSCNKSMLAWSARCGAEALQRTAESMQASMLYCCFCNDDFSREDIHYAKHIESICWPAGMKGVYEVRGDYCHIEAPVVITLVMELIGSLQWSSSAALLMFKPPHFPLVSALTHHATHESRQGTTTEWTKQTARKFIRTLICLHWVMFDAAALSHNLRHRSPPSHDGWRCLH